MAGGGGGRGNGKKGGGSTADGDGFAFRLGAGLGLEFSTLLGGSGRDGLLGVAIDGDRVHLGGLSRSTDFPTVNAVVDASIRFHGSSFGGGDRDPIVATFDFTAFVAGSTGPALKFASYLGGSKDDHAVSLAVDASGRLIVLGSVTGSGPKFPTKGTPQLKSTHIDYRDLFVVVLEPATPGRTLLYSSLLGGELWDEPGGLVLAPDGCWVVGIATSSGDLHTTPNRVQGPEGLSTDQRSAYVRVLPSPVGN